MNEALYEKWSKDTMKIRETILKMIHQINSGHPGGSLSMVEILYSLFAKDGVMKHDPKNPEKRERDRFVLSKGHGVPALYAILSYMGYDITEKELMTLRHLGSRLQGHPDRARISYMEASTGSLGQGLSIALGYAYANKLDKLPYRVFTLIGDGEMQEGQIWEAALSASHKKLGNLTCILDFNKGQIDGHVKNVLNVEPVKNKWEAFGWKVHEIDGHKYSEIVPALLSSDSEKPTMIIAHTVKGKGVSFMEDKNSWHGKAPTDEELSKALAEIQSKTIGL